MKRVLTQTRLRFKITVFFCVFALSVTSVFAQLKAKQARSMITRVAGSEFPNSAVRVIHLDQGNEKIATVLAEIETAFRFELNPSGAWRVRDIRIGPQRWEDVGALWNVPSTASDEGRTNAPGPCDSETSRGSELNVKRARCLLGQLLNVQLPSDAVRIKDVSPLSLPFSSNPSAVVVAVVRMEFGFEREGKEGWRINAIRTGSGEWTNLDDLRNTTTEMKRQRALSDLRQLADALVRYHQDRGFYVPTDQHRVLIDHLAPHYLARIIRLDPWHKPYEYQGERDHFTLRSDGPDGKPNTSDDLVISN